MPLDIKELTDRLQGQQKTAKDLIDEMEAKSKDPAYAAGEYTEKLDKIIADGKVIVKQIDLLREEKKWADMQQQPANKPTAEHAPANQQQQNAQPLQRKSWGTTFVEDEQFKAAMASGRRETPPINVKAGGAQYSAGGSTVTFNGNQTYGGALVVIDRLPTVADRAPYRPITILDMLSTSPTSSDTIQYAVITGKTIGAGVTPERNPGDTDFGTKPVSSMAFDIVTENVKTVAHWIPASRQILMDAPRLGAEIDTFLGDGLRLKVEDQVIGGVGGTDFKGILNTSGIQARVHQISGRGFVATDTIADTLRRAITDISIAFFEADGILMHPTDAEKLELLKDTLGNYLNIYDPIQQRIWRKPVIVSQVITAGTSIVANWRQGAMLWDRMQTDIRIGEPNDYFIKNAVAILAELRLAFGVIYPAMFEKVTGL